MERKQARLVHVKLADGTIRTDHSPGNLNQLSPAARLLTCMLKIMAEVLPDLIGEADCDLGQRKSR